MAGLPYPRCPLVMLCLPFVNEVKLEPSMNQELTSLVPSSVTGSMLPPESVALFQNIRIKDSTGIFTGCPSLSHEHSISNHQNVIFLHLVDQINTWRYGGK